MKVILFCGGLGTRLREYSETIPKPLVNIGTRPIMWHLMKYYSAYGHKDFVLCLGYRGDLIKEYFLNYQEYISNDFVISRGGKKRLLGKSDLEDWSITFVDTGLNSNLGERLMAVREHVEGEDYFLANYSDGLSDYPLDQGIAACTEKGAIASFVSVRPSQSFHAVEIGGEGWVEKIEHVADADYWINGGFFCFSRRIFDYMEAGEELVERPFQRLIGESRLYAHKYRGFWAAMDTFKDKKTFDSWYESGQTPWMIWDK